jgi:membrane-associated protease RseP (regulator of RpoE activity)
MESGPHTPAEGIPGAERWIPGPPPLPRASPRPPLPARVNLLCFLLTLLTTLIAGTVQTLNDLSVAWDVAKTPKLWIIGLPYSLSLILILGAHEMGHYVACRRYGLEATLPFFIPGLPPFGTFGAVIRIRSPFTGRRALFDVGVAGPLAGFAVALPILGYGLAHSTVVRQPPGPGEINLPSCLLLDLAFNRFFPALRPGDLIELHPFVAAAWVGLLATFLNLLPIGQLDGGHMLYALSRRAHRPVSLLVIVGLIGAGFLFGGVHLIVFGLLWAAIGARHPPLLDESETLGAGRVLVALLALAIFVLCFIPNSPRLG